LLPFLGEYALGKVDKEDEASSGDGIVSIHQ